MTLTAQQDTCKHAGVCVSPIKENKRKTNALWATPYLHTIRLFCSHRQIFMCLVFVCNWKAVTPVTPARVAARLCAGRFHHSQRMQRMFECESLQQGEMFPNASLQSSSSLSSTHTFSLLAPVKPFSLLPFIYLTCGLMHLLGRQD